VLGVSVLEKMPFELFFDCQWILHDRLFAATYCAGWDHVSARAFTVFQTCVRSR
jgi:hypothetical protein